MKPGWEVCSECGVMHKPARPGLKCIDCLAEDESWVADMIEEGD